MEFDCISQPVPDRLAAPFAYRRRLAGLCKRVEDLKDELLVVLDGPYTLDVDRVVIRRAVEVLTSEVMNNIPGYRCSVRPHPPSCTRCKGIEWVTPNQREMTSQRDHPSISPES